MHDFPQKGLASPQRGYGSWTQFCATNPHFEGARTKLERGIRFLSLYEILFLFSLSYQQEADWKVARYSAYVSGSNHI